MITSNDYRGVNPRRMAWLENQNRALLKQNAGLKRFAVLTFIFGCLVTFIFMSVVTMEPVWIDQVATACVG
ncbi:hypothetical protein G7Y31_06825 [Corynebacterium lizhenjunii]|uniref:Uncharacterized protein n=1 Tax=Corynebacterium lizhenjunii TaxID=2709394 RepID=A0A7T0P912_9CORY|nr:hypothetical protein [Corynebacterium lizhenjunii]QPK78298.1 hypothetical protein G7Y31_06825 [Corynebacterium lizhenjunii]